MQGNKGFVAGKVLVLMALILSLVSFCLLQKLMPATNNITERKNETDVGGKPNCSNWIRDKRYKASYNFPKINQSNCSNLNPYIIRHFSASQQELNKHDIKITFNWGRPNPWPIPKPRNNNQHLSNQVSKISNS